MNVSRYFKNNGVINALSVRNLFEFIMDKTFWIDEIEMDVMLDSKYKVKEEGEERKKEEEEEEKIFFQSFLPRSLNELVDYEKTGEEVKEGSGKTQTKTKTKKEVMK